MNDTQRCSKCVHWLHRKCLVTGQIKNDSICICGQFEQRKEN